jgi:phenylacetate-CoA ligase
MAELARRVSETGKPLPVRAIVATGENLHEKDRAYVEETLNIKFFLTYATWEVKWIGHECSERRIHINEEYVYVEIVDADGRVLPVGEEGRVVVTSFDSEAMPFIRYVLGDRGCISEEYCPCGKTSRTIKIFGRQSDIIELPDNRIVPLFDVVTAFDTYATAVRQYRIFQKSPKAFRVQIVAGPTFESQSESLSIRLRNILHPEADIEWDIVDFIPQAPSGKAKYFIREY